MKLNVCAIFLLCFPFLLVGQVDSDALWNTWNNGSETPQHRADALNIISSEIFLHTNSDSAYQLAKMALEFSEEKKLPQQTADALINMAHASSILGSNSQAVMLHNRSLTLSQSIDYESGVLKNLKLLGNVYLKKSDYGNAITYYSRCYKIAEASDNKEYMAKLQNNIGLVYMDLGDDEKALNNFQQSLQSHQELEDTNGESNILNNIGTIYRKRSEFQQALSFYNKSLALKNKHGHTRGLATCYSNIGLVNSALGKKEEAFKFISKSTAIHKKVGNQKGLSRNLIHIGKEFLPAKKDTAIQLISEAFSIAKASESYSEMADAAKLLYTIYYSDGNYKEAVKMQKILRETEDHMFSTRNQKAVFDAEFSNREAKYEKELEANKKELAANKDQSRRQRNKLLIGVGILALGLCAFLITRRRGVLQERKEQIEKIEQLKKKLTARAVSTSPNQKALSLDKAKIEKAIDAKLGESSWAILNLIFNNPSISNKEIADEIFLSVEGVSSSLRRMYTAFNIKSSSNKKITLLMTAVRMSFED